MNGTLALYNGVIHTLDPARPTAEAIGIVNGRVAAVGGDAEVRAAVGRGDGLDLRGRAVVPGLIDAHLHLLGLSLALAEIPLTGVRSIAQAVERVAARARETPPGRWLQGGGWNSNVLRDGRWPTTPASPTRTASTAWICCSGSPAPSSGSMRRRAGLGSPARTRWKGS